MFLCNTILLEEESQGLYDIVIPFGKFKHKQLPMGLMYSPDIAWQVMEDAF